MSLLALNGLRVSEAIGANIEALGLERGHRTLTVLRKGGKLVTMPLAPRVARAVDLAVGERVEGPIFLGSQPRTARSARRRADRAPCRSPCRDRQAGRTAHAASRLHHGRLGCRRAVARRTGSGESRRPTHDDALRPWPPIVRSARHLHRCHVHRRRCPLTTTTPAFGACTATNRTPERDSQHRDGVVFGKARHHVRLRFTTTGRVEVDAPDRALGRVKPRGPIRVRHAPCRPPRPTARTSNLTAAAVMAIEP